MIIVLGRSHRCSLLSWTWLPYIHHPEQILVLEPLMDRRISLASLYWHGQGDQHKFLFVIRSLDCFTYVSWYMKAWAKSTQMKNKEITFCTFSFRRVHHLMELWSSILSHRVTFPCVTAPTIWWRHLEMISPLGVVELIEVEDSWPGQWIERG